jgi:hypothetical protein
MLCSTIRGSKVDHRLRLAQAGASPLLQTGIYDHWAAAPRPLGKRRRQLLHQLHPSVWQGGRGSVVVVLALVVVVVMQSGRGPHATVSARRRNGRHLSGTAFRTCMPGSVERRPDPATRSFAALQVVIGEDGLSIQSELRALPSVSQSHVQDPTEVQGGAVTIAAAVCEPHDRAR